MEYKLKEDVVFLDPEISHEGLWKYVEIEARIIKENFDADTIENKLSCDLLDIDGNSMTECIYGQLTGSCNSPDAHAVIFKMPFIVVGAYGEEEFLQDQLNDEFAEKDSFMRRTDYFYTPIERYILPTRAEKAYANETEGYVYPEEYYERVRKVVDLLRKN